MSRRAKNWLPEWLETALSQPTTTIEVAGRAMGLKSRNAAYAAAKRGDIPTIPMGRRKPVPTARLRQILGLDK